MLIRPHDAATNDDEWRNLLTTHRFGTLIAPGTNRDVPVVVPTHVHFDGVTTIRLHLARPNPVWPALRENPRCLFLVVAAVTYVPTSWEAPPGTPPEWGIPTSHYAAVELDCTATITDDPADIRRYLADHLSTMQPDEPHGDPRARPPPTPPSCARSEDSNSPSTPSAPSSSSTAPNPTTCDKKSPTATADATHQATAKHSTTSSDATHPQTPEPPLNTQEHR